MSIASETTRIKNNVTGTYTSCNTKGASMPTSADQNSDNMADTILTIPQTGSGADLDGYISGAINVIQSAARWVKPYAFSNDRTITQVNIPYAETMGINAFYNCSELVSVDISNMNLIRADAFRLCSKLTSVSTEYLTSIGNSAFRDCVALATVNFPNLGELPTDLFRDCTSITSLSFNNLRSISSRAFYGCSSFNRLTIRTSSVCTLANENAFANTPFRNSSGGTVYVPSNLILSYQTADGWKDLYNRGYTTFAAIT